MCQQWNITSLDKFNYLPLHHFAYVSYTNWWDYKFAGPDKENAEMLTDENVVQKLKDTCIEKFEIEVNWKMINVFENILRGVEKKLKMRKVEVLFVEQCKLENDLRKFEVKVLPPLDAGRVDHGVGACARAWSGVWTMG